jgi:ribosomal protein S18 acetylase RimI-like enzyme
MKSKIEIRISVGEDALEVETLRISCWKKHYAGIIDQAFLDGMDPEKSYEARQKFIILQKNIHLVAVYDEKIIGLSDAGPRRSEQGALSEGEIYSLYVDEAFRRQGVGQLLFQTQCDLLRQRGFESIVVWALKENTSARNFYKKLNGALLEKEESFDVDGKEYPHVVYQWHFEEE